jgi:periplasmic divalent cation tolerance protein
LATFSENDMTVSESAHIQPAGEAAESVLMAMTNLPDEASAARVSRAVLEARVAACVNRLAPCQSEYWWQGKLEQAQEWPLLIKTTRAQYAALEAVIRAEHPYDVPELVAWPLGAGYAPYLAWVQQEASGKPAGDAAAPC